MRRSPAAGRSEWWKTPSDVTVNPERPGNARGRSSGSIDGAGLTPATKLRPPGLLELENLLGRATRHARECADVGQAGRVTIDFADLEDLERIYRVIAG